MRVTIIKSLITGIIPVLFSCQDSIINGEYSTSDVSVYLNPGQSGGTLVLTCRIYNSTSYIGTATHYLIITP